MNFANLMQGMGPNLLDAVGQGVLWGIMVLGYTSPSSFWTLRI